MSGHCYCYSIFHLNLLATVLNPNLKSKLSWAQGGLNWVGKRVQLNNLITHIILTLIKKYLDIKMISKIIDEFKVNEDTLLRLIEGDIAERNVDVIVNPANSYLPTVEV